MQQDQAQLGDDLTMTDETAGTVERPQRPATTKIIEKRTFQGDCGSVVQMVRDIESGDIKFTVMSAIDVPVMDWSDPNNPKFIMTPDGRPIGQPDPETGKFVPHLRNFPFDVVLLEITDDPNYEPSFEDLQDMFSVIDTRLEQESGRVKQEAISKINAEVAQLRAQWKKQANQIVLATPDQVAETTKNQLVGPNG